MLITFCEKLCNFQIRILIARVKQKKIPIADLWSLDIPRLPAEGRHACRIPISNPGDSTKIVLIKLLSKVGAKYVEVFGLFKISFLFYSILLVFFYF